MPDPCAEEKQLRDDLERQLHESETALERAPSSARPDIARRIGAIQAGLATAKSVLAECEERHARAEEEHLAQWPVDNVPAG